MDPEARSRRPPFVDVRRHEVSALRTFLLRLDDEIGEIVDTETVAAEAEGVFQKEVKEVEAMGPPLVEGREIDNEVDDFIYAGGDLREDARDRFRTRLEEDLRSQLYSSTTLLIAAT